MVSTISFSKRRLVCTFLNGFGLDFLKLTVLSFRFFVLILVYLVGGFLFLTYARGATGMERVPNFEFWADFPHLIKVSAKYLFLSFYCVFPFQTFNLIVSCNNVCH